MTDENKNTKAEEVSKQEIPQPHKEELKDTPALLIDPDQQFVSSPPAEVSRRILQIQSALDAILPTGRMFIHGSEISYITKHQVLNALIPLMVEVGLVCVYGGIHHIDTLDKRTVFMGNPRREYTYLKERLWVVYHLVELNSGAKYSQMVPADVAGMDSKNATVALAFAERDFLSQIFLVRARGDAATMEEVNMNDYSPMSVAKNLNMEGIRETLEIKANAAIHRVTRRRVDQEAKKQGITFKANTGDMTDSELLQVIDVCMEIMNPSTAKEHLASVCKEAS